MQNDLQVRARAELEKRRILEEEGIETKYEKFVIAYADDPTNFVLDCINFNEGEQPDPYQLNILNDLKVKKRICVRAPHGSGKSAMLSWAILWFSLTRDGMDGDWKIITTASAWRQLTKFLWPEVHKWAYRLKWDTIGRLPFNRDELLSRSIQLDHGEAFAVASNTPEFIEGAHANRVLYIFDESKKVPNGIWDSAEGAFATGDPYWLSCSTPGEQKGRFWQIQSKAPGYEDWTVYHITLDDFLKTGRVNEDWVKARKRQWGEDSVVYQNRVLGNFAADDTMGVIPLSWVEDAIINWEDWNDNGGYGTVTSIGVDVAGGKSGADKNTVAVCCDGCKISQIIHFMPKDPDKATMELVNFLAPLMDRFPTATLVIDTIGIGAGVAHRLREMGYRALGFVSIERNGLSSIRLC